MDMTTLDTACRTHLAHDAMAGCDPLTDSLFSLLDTACAEEGARPPSTAGAGPTAAQRAALAQADADPALAWLLPLGMVVGALASAVWQWGWAAQ